LTASVNSAAGVMGKMISLQSIAVAVAATGMTSADEGRLFRFTIKHSVLLMVVMGLISSSSRTFCRRSCRALRALERTGRRSPSRRWLDVACLFKTRSEAQKELKAGRISVNRQSVKPHRLIRVGDEIEIGRPMGRKQRVRVVGVTEQHLPRPRRASCMTI
jgi:ribosomal 50S subunit-recycling heat shock protein